MFEPLMLVWVAVIAACGGLALAVAMAAYLRPLQMLACGPLVVLLAGTKLRVRAAEASLQANLDWQVVLELGLYAGLAVIVAMSTVSVQLSRRRGFAPATALLFAYVAFCAVSVFWSLAPQLTLVRTFQLVTLAGLAWHMVGTLGPDRTFDVLRRSVVAYVLVCGAFGFAFPPDEEARFMWFAVHPITVATFTGVGAVLLLARSLFAGSRHPAAGVSWILFAAFVGVVLMTASRGPLFALVGSSTFLLVKRTPSAAVRFMLVLVLAFTITTAVAGGLVERLVVLGSRTDGWVAETILRGQDPDQFLGMTGRVELWESVVPFVAERPLIGYGYQGSRALLLDTASWAAYAHNAYLQTLLDLGVIGTVLLFAPLGWTTSRAVLRPLSRGHEAAAGRVAAIVFLLMNGMTSESFAAAPGFEIFVVLLVATAQRRDRAVLQARSAAAFGRMHPGLSRSPAPLRS